LRRTHDGRKFRILTIIDEFSRECLALVVARKLNHEDVLTALAELFFWRGAPAHIRSDNGSEFIAGEVQKWLGKIGVKTLYITPGSPWEKGYKERLGFTRLRPNGSLRDELLNGEIFYSLAEARVLIEAWRRHYIPSALTAASATARRPQKRRHRHGRPPVPLRSTSARPWRRRR
jgi:transposase InsO family protein